MLHYTDGYCRTLGLYRVILGFVHWGWQLRWTQSIPDDGGGITSCSTEPVSGGERPELPWDCEGLAEKALDLVHVGRCGGCQWRTCRGSVSMQERVVDEEGVAAL